MDHLLIFGPSWAQNTILPLQLAIEKVQVPNIGEISIIYLYMEKNGIEILLSLTIYFLSK